MFDEDDDGEMPHWTEQGGYGHGRSTVAAIINTLLTLARVQLLETGGGGRQTDWPNL